ncbi:MAG TPA: hypothetical protein VFH00_10280 [Candidatus Nitrosotalea sp.]|nr:hypothetical protein [Candidatus Nitrosotalea sp.]
MWAFAGGLALLTPFLLPTLDAWAFGPFRQDQRINQLTLQFSTDSFAMANAFGGAFTPTGQASMQSRFSSGITSGAMSLLFEMPGLADLTGTNEPSLHIGVVNGVPINSVNPYNGNSDLDWWYSPSTADLDAMGVPKQQLSGAIAAKVLTAVGPSIRFVSDTWPLVMSTVQIAANIGTMSTPLTSAGYSPPGHPASDQINPALQSFGSMSAGQLKGNISAASLSVSPVSNISCDQAYTSANTMLDVLVSGCTVTSGLVTIPVILRTQPDQLDPAAPAAGAGPPYHLGANSITHRVDSCTDKNLTSVLLATCLNATAYSSYFKFTTDRVIGKAPQVITFTSTAPANPVVGDAYAATATGGASGNPVVFSPDAASTPGACSVSSSGSVSFTGAGSCIVDADQAGTANYFAAQRVSQSFMVTVPRASVAQSSPAPTPGSRLTAAGPGGNAPTRSGVAQSSPHPPPAGATPIATKSAMPPAAPPPSIRSDPSLSEARWVYWVAKFLRL